MPTMARSSGPPTVVAVEVVIGASIVRKGVGAESSRGKLAEAGAEVAGGHRFRA